MRVPRRRRQRSTMGFNNRAANRKTHSHAVTLGGEEGIEDAVDILWRDNGAGIGDIHNHTVARL
jgi:hypothetical protein